MSSELDQADLPFCRRLLIADGTPQNRATSLEYRIRFVRLSKNTEPCAGTSDSISETHSVVPQLEAANGAFSDELGGANGSQAVFRLRGAGFGACRA